jgi:hypothetical protein
MRMQKSRWENSAGLFVVPRRARAICHVGVALTASVRKLLPSNFARSVLIGHGVSGKQAIRGRHDEQVA